MTTGSLVLPSAQAFTTPISPGTRAVYLQVGVGRMTGGNFNSGGTPGNNTIVNSASVSVPVAALGNGTAQPMTTNSTVTASAFDGFQFCNSPATTGQVYVGGFYRTPGTGAASSLTVTTTTNLTNAAGDTIPFNRIAWTSSGNGDPTGTIPSGAFTGGTQTLLSVGQNFWFESCLAFRYLNTQLVPGGTFTGRATYTLSAP
ncbi:MAG: hypothetical protein KKC79_06885 [Gammaproteobacteria bacterium]|nr:hypothetical protein [Gammaproteobacteria bacterium]MBU1441550.1 hypothetical protein [Gammaproteobacteria bacterium]MBU2285264.1 hypothetical protein [Gammaproteobacteria bacterium]MBU2408360.1 hypothetical protein [Gammaproteobacteria bacterium]